MEKRASQERPPRTRRGRKPLRPARKLPDKLIVPQEAEVFQVYPDQAGMRLDQFLKQRLHWRSRTKVQELLETREVTVSGVRVGRSYRVKLDEQVRLPLPPPPEAAHRIAEIPLEILYEDDLIIILNKPPDLVVHPVGKHRYDTLINALHLRYRDLNDPKKDILPKLAHRIDRETSGVLIAYKMRRHERSSPLVFERAGVTKHYLAIAEGIVEQDSGVIDLPIGRQSGVDSNRAKCVVAPGGQPSRTGYEVLERFPLAQGRRHGEAGRLPGVTAPCPGEAGQRHGATGVSPGEAGLTFLRCRPFTGRMHQIRVHLQAIGHPVLCDKIYGLRKELRLSDLGPLVRAPGHPEPFDVAHGPEPVEGQGRTGGWLGGAQEDRLLLSRHALHAHRITFTHPVSRAPVTVEAPLPPDMQRVLEALRAR